MNWLIDAGHGGYGDKGYTTSPNKMFTFPDGTTIYEGVVNRGITDKLSKLLIASNIDWQFIHDSVIDTPLKTRVTRANNAFAKRTDSVLLSIHSNAGGGTGFEVFTSKGLTVSDNIAQYFIDSYKANFPEKKFRSDFTDGDEDKEADFYVLRNTKCPAVLVENLFFDNREEADFLLSEKGQISIAVSLYEAIKKIEQLN